VKVSTQFLFENPHSLGILIEWKLLTLYFARFFLFYPHSLGILIEWKHKGASVSEGHPASHPHSLGILIEWKQRVTEQEEMISAINPHSLGILIEWKQWHCLLRQRLPSSRFGSPLAGDPN